MPKIERSNQPGQFTLAEIRAAVAETKRQKAQPGYQARIEREKRATEAKAKARGTRFPDLAKLGTKPEAASIAAHRARLLKF